MPSKRKDPLFCRTLVQGLVLTLLLSSSINAQWVSYKNSRNPKSNLWFPNMPGPRTLQQRSSGGGTVRGLSSSSSGSSNINSNSNSPLGDTRQRSTRPLNHRSTQPNYQTVHGGVISRQESLTPLPRGMMYQSNNNQRDGSVRVKPMSNQNGQQQSRSHYSSGGNQHQNSNNRNSQFSSRSGQPMQQSWFFSNQQSSSGNKGSAPTVVTSKHLSINLNNSPQKNKLNLQVGPATSASSSNGYTNSKRLLEVGRSGLLADPTRRPITQIAGALQDSWPNSMAHHHLSPFMKNQQKPNNNGGRNYYDSQDQGSSPWGSHVRVSDPIEIKTFDSNKYKSQEGEYSEIPVDRRLSVTGVAGREKLVSNTLNTLAKLSPKKPIYVFMRAEGIAAVRAGADAGEVIKKLAGSSKLPFYNGTRSLPKDMIPTVFLAPDDMTAPRGYGKIPIPNLKQKEAIPKPSYTKILLPGGTKMVSHLSNQVSSTTTPSPSQSPLLSTSHSMVHPSIQQYNPNFNQSSIFSAEGLTLEQKMQIIQMIKGQAQAGTLNNQGQQAGQQGAFSTGYPNPHSMLQGDSVISGLAGPTSGPFGVGNNLNAYSQFAVPAQQSNSLGNEQYNPTGNNPNVQSESDYQKMIGSIVEDAVSQTVGKMLPAIQRQQQEQHHQQQQFQQQQFVNQQQQQFIHHQQQQQQQNHQIQNHQMQNHQIQNQFGPTQASYAQQIHMLQSKIGQGLNSNQQPLGPPPQNLHHRPRPTSPKPPRLNAIKNALSMFGIQSTPRPEQGRTSSPMPPHMMQSTPRPFPNVHHHSQPRPGGPNGPPPNGHATRGPPLQHHGRPPFPHHHHHDSGSMEHGQQQQQQQQQQGQQQQQQQQGQQGQQGQQQQQQQQGQQGPGQTIIVQTPDRSKPNGQKSTYIITGGESENLELNKIMKVLSELNGGEQQQKQQQPTNGPPPHFLNEITGSPSSPRPTMIPFGRPSPSPHPQQPQVMIRHPSGTPTPGPILMSTGGPTQGIQFVSSTQLPQHYGPTQTPRPMFVSSTPRPLGPSQMPVFVSSTPQPMFNNGPTNRPQFVSSTRPPMVIGSSPSSIQIIKAIEPGAIQLGQQQRQQQQQHQMQHQQQKQHQQQTQQNQQQQNTIIYEQAQYLQPQQQQPKIVQQAQRQPQVIFSASPSPQTINNIYSAVSQNTNKAPAATLISSAEGSKIIEIDPSATPEQIQQSIMQTIMKHQGGTLGPISIQPYPSSAPVGLGNTHNILNMLQQQQQQSPSQKQTGGFTVLPATIDQGNPSPNKTSSSVESQKFSKESSERIREGSQERSKTRLSAEKVHHHSKEVIEEKPHLKNKEIISGENSVSSSSSSERNQKNNDNNNNNENEPSSEVIEKVITEEKIVWNPGPGEGEMIPSRIKTEERIILRPHNNNNNNVINANKQKKLEAERRMSVVDDEMQSLEPTKTIETQEESNDGLSSGKSPLFRSKLVGLKSKDTDEDVSKGDEKLPSNFAGLLRSKIKFENMRQKLYPEKPAHEDQKNSNPFSRYLNSPSSTSTTTTNTAGPSTIQTTSAYSTVAVTSQQQAMEFNGPSSTAETLSHVSSPQFEHGRFKIRPGEVSNRETNSNVYQGPVYGITPSGQTVLLSPTPPSFVGSPSSPGMIYHVGPTGPSPSAVPSYIGPSPSSIPFSQSPMPPMGPSPTYPSIVTPVSATKSNLFQSIAPGTKEEKLMFIPADSIRKDETSTNGNGQQNQTVVFTTMNQLPNLMAQLSGTNTEVRMIDDLKTWEDTMNRVNKASTENPTPTAPSTTPTPTQSANRRSDGVDQDDQPMTWRPNGTIPTPTLESLRKRFPNGVGANVLHAVSAGFAANDMRSKWANNGNQFYLNHNNNNNQDHFRQQQPQVFYTMANGVPVAINISEYPAYNPVLLQGGTKEPVLAYLGYNWNSIPQASTTASSPIAQPLVNPTLDTEVTYRSRFRGTAPPAIEETEGTIHKTRKNKDKTSSTTLSPIDPLSQEYDDVPEQSDSRVKSKNTANNDDNESSTKHNNRRKGGSHSNEYEEDVESKKNHRRRRPGALKDVHEDEDKENKKFIQTQTKGRSDDEIDEDDSEESEETPKISKKKYKPAAPFVSSTNPPPNILSRRVDESDEDLVVIPTRKPVKVNHDMFMISGEERKIEDNTAEVTPARLVDNNPQPTSSKLPIFLAPSIINSKSVVANTGSSYSSNSNNEGESLIKIKTTEQPSTTTQLLTTLLNKLTTTTKVSPTVETTNKIKVEDEDFKATQTELKELLKKIQQKLGRGDDYELGDTLYDYYEEVPSTKATTTTTTTTTKSTQKPKKSNTKSKSKKSKSKSSTKSKTSKKNKKTKKSKASKKSKITTKKPKITTTTTDRKPELVSSTTTFEPTEVTPTVLTVLKQNHRHPINSLESFTSPIAPSNPPTVEVVPQPTSTESSESSSSEPQPFQQPQIGSSTEIPIEISTIASEATSTVSFIYSQSEQNKDTAGPKVHYRTRPLWVRRKGAEGSTENSGLQAVGQPSGEGSNKVIRLVRRRKPGVKRRPVFVQQSVEQISSSSSTTTSPIPVSEESSTQQSTTTPLTIDSLFDVNNELGRRVGIPDSSEGSHYQSTTTRPGLGKRKLKLIRLKGQRAQWRLKMNDQDSFGEETNGPHADSLIATPITASHQSQSQSHVHMPEFIGGIEASTEARESRQVPPSSLEARVCISGKCEFITKH